MTTQAPIQHLTREFGPNVIRAREIEAESAREVARYTHAIPAEQVTIRERVLGVTDRFVLAGFVAVAMAAAMKLDGWRCAAVMGLAVLWIGSMAAVGVARRRGMGAQSRPVPTPCPHPYPEWCPNDETRPCPLAMLPRDPGVAAAVLRVREWCPNDETRWTKTDEEMVAGGVAGTRRGD